MARKCTCNVHARLITVLLLCSVLASFLHSVLARSRTCTTWPVQSRNGFLASSLTAVRRTPEQLGAFPHRDHVQGSCRGCWSSSTPYECSPNTPEDAACTPSARIQTWQLRRERDLLPVERSVAQDLAAGRELPRASLHTQHECPQTCVRTDRQTVSRQKKVGNAEYFRRESRADTGYQWRSWCPRQESWQPVGASKTCFMYHTQS